MTAAVFVGIGSNLPSSRFGQPLEVVSAAVDAMMASGLSVQRRSRWYVSAPLPASDQPDFINGVVQLESEQEPTALMAALHAIEAAFGRERTVRDAARILDLDLLAVGDCIRKGRDTPILPHPRLHLRAFVLRPLVELAPSWWHPLLERTAAELLAALPYDQRAEPLARAATPDAPRAGQGPVEGLLASGSGQELN